MAVAVMRKTGLGWLSRHDIQMLGIRRRRLGAPLSCSSSTERRCSGRIDKIIAAAIEHHYTQTSTTRTVLHVEQRMVKRTLIRNIPDSSPVRVYVVHVCPFCGSSIAGSRFCKNLLNNTPTFPHAEISDCSSKIEHHFFSVLQSP